MTNVRRAAGLIAVTSALALLVAVAPNAWPSEDRPTRQEVLQALQVDEVPADYIVLIDTSGSMNKGGLYGDVGKTLAAFFAGLTPTDHLAVYTFDDFPTPRYLGPASDPVTALNSLPPRPTLSGNTDIGAALAAALDELERPAASPVAAVVLLTDGQHAPPKDSPYLDSQNTAWQALTGRATKLDTNVKGYALSLRGETGAPLLRTVFAETTVLDPTTSTNQLAEYLNRAKEATRIEKARTALESDIGQGIVAEWGAAGPVDLSSGQAPVTVTLHARTTHAPLAISGLAITAGDGIEVSGDIPADVDLAPGGALTLNLTLRSATDAGLIPFRRTIETAPIVAIHGTVTTPWGAALSPEIDLETPGDVGNASTKVDCYATVGTWLVQLAVAALVLLVVLVIMLVLHLRRPRMTGMLVATTGDNEVLGHFRLRGRRTRLRKQALPGRAIVVARRVTQDYRNPTGLEYQIRYRRNSTWDRGSFRAGGSTLLSGVSFAHQETGAHGATVPEPVSSTGPSR